MDKSNIDYAEGRVFSFEDESAIQPGFLETIEYLGPRQYVSYQMNEFAAVCPFSGLPDTGIVWVEYVPKQKLVELKALKYYFLSFRNVGAVGSGARTEDGKIIPMDVKIGDLVLFGKWSGTEVKIDGKEYSIMKESDIMGISKGKK